jgi:hypothetical protein
MSEKLLIEIQADIKDLKTNLDKASKQIENFTKDNKKATQNIEKNSIDMNKAFEIAFGVGISQLALQGAEAIRKFVVDSIKASMKLEQAMQSLKYMTSNTADSLVKNLKEASKGMVTDLELVGSANKALALGIKQNDLPGLMDVARVRAKLMGITTTQAFQDISIGIGRQSKMILDNLGIVINLELAYAKYAKTLGVNVNVLDDFQKKQAITNAIMEENRVAILASAFAIETNQEKYERLSTTVQNYGTQIFSLTNLLMMLDMALKSANPIALVNSLDEGTDSVDNFKNSLSPTIQELNNMVKESKTLQETLDKTWDSLREATGKKFSGESQIELDIANKKLDLDKEKLDLLHNEKSIRDSLSAKGRSDKEIEEITEKLTKQKIENIKKYQNELEILELQKRVNFEDERLRMQEDIDVKEENANATVGIVTQTAKEVSTQIDLMNTKWIEDKVKVDDLNTSINTTTYFLNLLKTEMEKDSEAITKGWTDKKNSIEDVTKALNTGISAAKNLIANLKLAIRLQASLNSGGGGGSSSSSSGQDFISRPGKPDLKFSAEDTVFAVKHPERAMSSSGSGSFNIYINNLSGVSSSEISKALKKELQGLIAV